MDTFFVSNNVSGAINDQHDLIIGASRGYRYILHWQRPAGRWVILAGCRVWRTVHEMRKHYGGRWLRVKGVADIPRKRKRYERHRQHCLMLADQIEEFAKHNGSLHGLLERPPARVRKKRKTRRAATRKRKV